ncbi:hypothetical protein M9458_039675, partial [Cirrhinus mrigala]
AHWVAKGSSSAHQDHKGRKTEAWKYLSPPAPQNTSDQKLPKTRSKPQNHKAAEAEAEGAVEIAAEKEEAAESIS